MSSSAVPRVCTSYGLKFIEMFSEYNPVAPATPPPAPKWTQLTENEVRAIIQSHLFPNTAPPVPVRPPDAALRNQPALAENLAREHAATHDQPH
ncbi:hypothetical protein DFH08DRAFT_949307 [Mycena albidolilacea]|uniref:Uncharacterized protein n=1 Tax=Mycena albidolilacea TaxID=1033008 RepID=A0AAD7ASU1_9AGAR|nr:hypothetical protein DFH08DRAFT_949307 [Mycena albidolilacea]